MPDCSWLSRSEQTADAGARLGLMRQAEDVLLEELPVLPLYFGTQVFLMAKEVTGYSGKAFGDRAAKQLGF